MTFRWTPELMDRLEAAVRQGRRVAVTRRGTEYVVTPLRLSASGRQDAFVGRLPMTGDELTFILNELDGFEVL